MPELKIIDIHAHAAGPGDKKQGLYWHKRFADDPNFQKLKFIKGISLKKISDKLMINSLLKQTRSTVNEIDNIVILAFDNVYDVDGTFRGPAYDSGKEINSSFFVSNQFVKELCEQSGNSNLRFGLSVHPFRNDAIQQLEKYHSKAVLCKWLPSSQMIEFESDNPEASRKLNLFYDKLSELKLPLLFHCGREDSVPSAGGETYQKYNNPKYIEDALEKGVCVILAHCGCSYFDETKRTDAIPEVLKLFKKMEDENKPWKLYADISAVYSPYRKKEILDEVFNNIKSKHLIYGSDWPIPSKGPRWWANPLWILNYSGENLFNRYKKICNKWLPEYFSADEVKEIYTNFHKILNALGKGHLI